MADPSGRDVLTVTEKRKLLEQVDIVWINLKLAEISRKHGLPNLAENYQQKLAKHGAAFGGETFKLEFFKQIYERFKLKMNYCTEEVTQHGVLK